MPLNSSLSHSEHSLLGLYLFVIILNSLPRNKLLRNKLIIRVGISQDFDCYAWVAHVVACAYPDHAPSPIFTHGAHHGEIVFVRDHPRTPISVTTMQSGSCPSIR